MLHFLSMGIETSVIGQILFTHQSGQPETTSHQMPNMKERKSIWSGSNLVVSFELEQETCRLFQIKLVSNASKTRENVCWGLHQSGDE